MSIRKISSAFLDLHHSDEEIKLMVYGWLGRYPDPEESLRALPRLKNAVVALAGNRRDEVKKRLDKLTRNIANDYGAGWTCSSDRPPGRPTESPSGKPRENVTVRIDPDLRDKAKTHNLKLGPLLENAIINIINALPGQTP